MLEAILQKKRYERWPEDSGEWTPVPLEFKHLTPPEPWGQRLSDIPPGLKLTAKLLPLYQFLLGAGLFFLAACLPDSPNGVWWFFTAPAVVGFFSALCATLYVADGSRARTLPILGAVMHGQLWWGLLLLIPCYGWGVLMLCVPPCTVATLLGTLAACALRTRNHDRQKP